MKIGGCLISVASKRKAFEVRLSKPDSKGIATSDLPCKAKNPGLASLNRGFNLIHLILVVKPEIKPISAQFCFSKTRQPVSLPPGKTAAYIAAAEDSNTVAAEELDIAAASAAADTLDYMRYNYYILH
jgi:hypothetical protein